MRIANKNKKPRSGRYDVKAAIIRKHGTIAAYIRATGKKPGTVYAAIAGRRDGPVSRAIKTEALQ